MRHWAVSCGVPLVCAGGIGDERAFAEALRMGYAGAQLGTRFVVAEECQAHDRFKDVFIKARSREAIATPQYSSKLPVVAVRALNNPAMDNFGKLQLDLLKKLETGELNRQDAQFEVEKYWVGSLRDGAVDPWHKPRYQRERERLARFADYRERARLVTWIADLQVITAAQRIQDLAIHRDRDPDIIRRRLLGAGGSQPDPARRNDFAADVTLGFDL